MRIASDRPAPIYVPPGAREVEVRYTGPVLQDEVIGHIPEDGLEYMNIPATSGNEPVIRPQPVLDSDGKVKRAEQKETLDLRPYSALKHALVGGSIGAVVGGVAGAVAGLVSGAFPLVPWLAAGGASAGAALTGAVAAHRVHGDQTSADWELQPVVRHELKGFSHLAVPQTMTTTDSKGNITTTNTGWYHHTYLPDVEKNAVGEEMFWAPVVRHTRGQDDWLTRMLPQ